MGQEKERTKVALLGAGHIGRTIARLLVECGDYGVTVCDQDVAARESMTGRSRVDSTPSGVGGALAHPGHGAPAARSALSTRLIDSSSPAALQQAIKGHDAVINALPYNFAVSVATAAREARCHYFDLTEDVAATRATQALAQDAPITFMPQCGLAPGFIGIVAHHLAQGFDTLHEVRMRVGALPIFPTNALKYNLTWSVDGLINEYCHPCEAIRDGQAIEALPLEGLEHFSLDGTEYEAFNTSGGLGTLRDTLSGRVRSLDYKSVRYPGHRAAMKMLLEDLQLRDDQTTLKATLRQAIPGTMQDVLLVFVTISGLKRGSLVQEVFAHKIFAQRDGADPLSAIQITTVAGICAALDLFREGMLPQSGFIRQEQVKLPDFLANRFGAAYTQSRQVESIS